MFVWAPFRLVWFKLRYTCFHQLSARTLGSNIHVARGLIKNAAQGDIFY